VIISAELIAAHLGIDLWACVVDKFNKTSDKHGFPIKMDKEGGVVKDKKPRIKKQIGPQTRCLQKINGRTVLFDGKGNIIGEQG
jgi:hypothetical protein